MGNLRMVRRRCLMASCTRGPPEDWSSLDLIGALIRFRVSSPNQENGFVGLAVRFVAAPGTKRLHGIESSP